MDSGYAEMLHEVDVLEYRLNQHYRQAEKELQEKINKYYKDFDRLDQKKREQVAKGELSNEDYKKWRQNKIMSGKVWEQRKDVISRDLYNTNYMARNMVYDKLPDVYASAHNFATYQVESGAHVDTSYTLYNRGSVERLIADNPDLLPYQKINYALDTSWNKKNLQAVMIQGILQGESIPHLAKRLSKTVTQKNRAAAIRNARTMATSAYNGGKMDAFKRAKALGIDMKVRWRATFDNRTRDSHRALDGETVEVGQPFSNGLTFPCDMSFLNNIKNGSEKVINFSKGCRETYNCRCTIQGVSGRLESRAIKYRSNAAVGISYEDWKKGHKYKPIEQNEKPSPTQKQKDNQTVNKAYEEQLRNKIYETYDKHIDTNNLQLLKTADFIEEKDKKDFSAFNAYWGNLDNETVKPFTEQLIKLMDEYDTPLYNIRFFDKMDMLGNKDAFAYVYHDYKLDRAEMRINPVKCSGDKMLSRLKELKAQRYVSQIKDGTESVYIVTHEFAHTLLELTEKFPNKQNWAGADFKHLQNVRKDIYSVYNEYLKDLEKAEKRWQDTELKFLNGDMSTDVIENALKYRQEYDEIFISKYALKDENEFMAECFASAILCEKPNKYSLRVKEILDDNFKRKK